MKRLVLALSLCLSLGQFLLVAPIKAQAAQATSSEVKEPALIRVETDRPLATVHPHQDTLGRRIKAQRADGSMIPSALLQVHLKAPATPWLASTDFPVVEGSSLLAADVQLNQGEFAFQFMPPIRGTYTLSVRLKPEPGDSSFLPTQVEWQATITESPQRKLNLSILLLTLVTVGGVSGFILGRNATAALVLLLALGSWRSPVAWAHGDKPHTSVRSSLPASAVADEQGDRVELQILTTQPRVGELMSLTARYVDQGGRLQPARFRLTFTQLEHQSEVFATELLASDGILRWQGQLYDGSDHRVSVAAVPLLASFAGRKAAHAEQDVAVEGIAPPPRSVIKSFGFLLGLTALAMAIGILLGRILPRKEGGLI